jgi:uncharacterized protein (TIGR02270 family)
MSAQPVCLAGVVSEHVAEAAFLRSIRGSLLAGARVSLRDVMRLDERIAAHLDGVAVAAESGARLVQEALATTGVGEVFVAAISALDRKDPRDIDRLCALVESVPDTLCGLTSAFGWLEPSALRGTVRRLLADPAPFRQRVAIAACAQHRVDPGPALDAAIYSEHDALRARALKCAGELGRRDALQACVEHLQDPDPACAFWAAWSAVLLGNRGSALAALRSFAALPGEMQRRALQLTCMVSIMGEAHTLLKQLVKDAANARTVMHGVATAGDPYFAPWLLAQMKDDTLARPAGEAFSMITGADLSILELQRDAPADQMSPDDASDEDLPWPDAERVQHWWAGNAAQFTPGGRLFVGAPVSRTHCMQILQAGYQHQRALAALHVSLLAPGTPLFNTNAPAWRQQQLLARAA